MASNRSKSTLFLIEQLIVVAVFAICAVACVRILTAAYFTSRDTRDVSHAIIVAETAAESFKAVSGDFNRTASIIGGSFSNLDGYDAVIVYFDSGWHLIDSSNAEQAYYVLHLISNDNDSDSSRIHAGQVTVSRLHYDDDILIDFEVVARR